MRVPHNYLPPRYTTRMKFLIGILYCGESQYEACKAAIEAQSHTDWELFEVKDLPNHEAHQTLFQTFSDNSSKFDAFVKIDADMELCHNDFLKELALYFTSHASIDQVTMKVDDFFTGRLIWGLNAFRSSVVFSNSDEVYTDKAAQVEEGRFAHLKRHKTLVPAAWHGFNPTDYQAFYFGCHKAVKVMHRQSRSHMRNIRRLPFAALKRLDTRPLLAYAGAAVAFKNEINPDALDHDKSEIRALFNSVMQTRRGRQILDIEQYRKIIRKAQTRYLK